MYGPGNDTRNTPGDSAVTLKAKEVIMEAFDAMAGSDEAAQAGLWKTVRNGRETLNQEVHRKNREYEQRMRAKRLAEADGN